MNGNLRSVTPLFLVFLMNILGFSSLLFNLYDGGINVSVALVGCGLLALILITFSLIRVLKMGDEYLFLIVSALLSVGIIMLLRIDVELGTRQTVWFAVAVACYFLVYFLYKKFKHWDKLFFVYFFGAVLLFLATLLFGTTVNGAKNWIYIGSQGFQPSELIKLMFVFSLACLFSPDAPFKSNLRRNIFIMFVVYTHLGFLVLQREWGIAVLFFLIYIAMLFVYGNNTKIALLNFGLAALGGSLGYKVLYHIQTRVAMWLDPFSDPTGRGYQIVQSLIAISAGGFAGIGFGHGSPEFIPEVQSDFIFSVICEELGILGGVGIVMLFFIFVYRGFKITLSVKNSFHKMIALGISVMFSFQTFIIIGGVIKLIPLTGITLPFISYGGSSLITCFMALGVLQAISCETEDETDALE